MLCCDTRNQRKGQEQAVTLRWSRKDGRAGRVAALAAGETSG